MDKDKREQEISNLLKKNGIVSVKELSILFNVSEVTVRNYLTDMEKKGLLSRTHGGAVSSYKPYYTMNMTQRLETNQKEKADIATRVASMIAPNDTVMFNSGTTTLLTFRKLPPKYNLSIVTNSIAIALEASSNPNYNVVLIGGSLNTKYQFSYGSDAIAQLRNYHADKLILSVDGVDISNGFTTYYNTEAEVDRVMTEQSDKCIVVADYSKFNRSAFAKICDISVADSIVTDTRIEDSTLSTFKDLGPHIYYN